MLPLNALSVHLVRQRDTLKNALEILRAATGTTEIEIERRREISDASSRILLSRIRDDHAKNADSFKQIEQTLGISVTAESRLRLDALRVEREAELECVDQEWFPHEKRPSAYKAIDNDYISRAARIDAGEEETARLPLEFLSERENEELDRTVSLKLMEALAIWMAKAQHELDEWKADEREAKRRELLELAEIRPASAAIVLIRRELAMMRALAEQAKGSEAAAHLLMEHLVGSSSVISGAEALGGEENNIEEIATEAIGLVEEAAEHSQELRV